MPEIITTLLSAASTACLKSFAEKAARLGGEIVLIDYQGSILYSDDSQDAWEKDGLAECADVICSGNSDAVIRVGPDNEQFGICVKLNGKEKAALLLKSTRDDLLENPDYVEILIETFVSTFQEGSSVAGKLEKIGSELAMTYEELMLVYNLSTNMKVTQTYANYLQMACDSVTQLINVEGIAVFIEKKIDGIDRMTLTAGSGVVSIDQVMIDILQNNLVTELNQGRDALLDSDVDTPFKYDWPESVHNLIAVPLQGNEHMIGVMVATNIIGKPDFDSIESKLFNCVANQCAVFIENGRLFGDLKELFIGSLKALTNSIDAKDKYTRGHSERVAFISRWIAERLSETRPISDEQIHRIYLAGLLHDIGKIGVGEAVLCKKGKLTDDERTRIMAHPRIGASILSDIKQMEAIVPGVLYHHERIDGKGYPDGLMGNRIPLIGKIIALADSFDAMTSRRIYRDAMSIKRALAEIEKGLGTQFDEGIGRVFLDNDVHELWNVILDGFIESWDFSNFSEYGAVAVGTLIR